jgi:hypothetical protein
MSETRPVSPDPAIQPPPLSGGQMDYPAHIQTYNGFMNLLKWFTIHMALLLVGLYFMIIANGPWTGGFFVLVAIAALVFGLMRNPNLNQDVQSAATGGPPSE